METFDVVVWKDSLSDGSIGYSSWCSYVRGVWGQGDTESEALAEISAAMTDVILHPWDDGESLADGETAASEMAELMRELADEGISYCVHRVSVPSGQLTNV